MLKGAVLRVERTGETKVDDEGLRWERCVFTVSLMVSPSVPQAKNYLKVCWVRKSSWLDGAASIGIIGRA